MRSAVSSRLCRASRQRNAGRDRGAAAKRRAACADTRQWTRCLARCDAAHTAARGGKHGRLHRGVLSPRPWDPCAQHARRNALHGQQRGLCLGHAISRWLWPTSAADWVDCAHLVQRIPGGQLVIVRFVRSHDRRLACFDLSDRTARPGPAPRDIGRFCDDALPALLRRQGRSFQQLSGSARGHAADCLAVPAGV